MSRPGLASRRAPALAAGLAAAALALLATGCLPHVVVIPAGEAGPGDELTGQPAVREGWTAYLVGGALRVEAPSGWTARGDANRIRLDAEGSARLEAWRVDDRFEGGKACLAAAEASLERGEAQLSHVRRHPTTLAGRPAVVQEADAAGWHGWAYAVCAGGSQYRLVFTGRSPIGAPLLEAWREVVKGVRLGGDA